MTDMLTELRRLAQSWRDDAGAASLGDPFLDHADALTAIIGDEPVLPVIAGLGQVTATLEIALSTVIIPGDDDRPEGLTLGHLVASQIARNVGLGDGLRKMAEDILRDRITAEAARLVAEVLAGRRSAVGGASRKDLTIAQLIVAEMHRQLTEPSPTASARGRMDVPVIEAIIAGEVTTAMRELTAGQVAQIRAKILADIAVSGGR